MFDTLVRKLQNFKTSKLQNLQTKNQKKLENYKVSKTTSITLEKLKNSEKTT